MTEPAAWDSGGISPEAYLKGLGGQSAAAPPSHADEGMTPDEYVAAKTAPSRRAEAKPVEEKSLLGRIGEGAYNAATALTGGAPPEQRGVTADSFWPVRMAKGIANAVHSGVTAPADAYAGRLQVSDPATGMPTPEAIGRAIDAANLMVGKAPITGLTKEAGSSGAASNFISGQLPKYVDQKAISSASALMDDAAARGVKLTWPEALSQVTGKPVLLDMQRVLEGAKQTRARMAEAIGDRPAQIKGAAEQEISGLAPPTDRPSGIGPAVGEAAISEVDRARSLINKSSEPYYDAARTHRLDPADMATLRQTPGFKEAVKAVRNDEIRSAGVKHLPNDSVAFLNQVKKYLDEAKVNAEQPLQPGHSVERASGFGRAAQTVRDTAIGSEAKAGEANYAQALDIQQQGRRQYLDPMLQGPLGKLAEKNIPTKNAIEALFPSSPLAGSEREISTAVEALSRQNPAAARQLVRAHVEQKLNEAFDAAGRGQEAPGYAGASFAHRLAGSPAVETQRGRNFEAAVKALPNGEKIWPGIQRFLDIARATGTRRTPGSPTGYVEAELKGMGGGSKTGQTISEILSPGNYLHIANDLWAKWQTGKNLGELARIITDPKSEAIFRSLGQQSTASRNAVKTAARLTALRATEILGLPRKSPSDK